MELRLVMEGEHRSVDVDKVLEISPNCRLRGSALEMLI